MSFETESIVVQRNVKCIYTENCSHGEIDFRFNRLNDTFWYFSLYVQPKTIFYQTFPSVLWISASLKLANFVFLDYEQIIFKRITLTFYAMTVYCRKGFFFGGGGDITGILVTKSGLPPLRIKMFDILWFCVNFLKLQFKLKHTFFKPRSKVKGGWRRSDYEGRNIPPPFPFL